MAASLRESDQSFGIAAPRLPAGRSLLRDKLSRLIKKFVKSVNQFVKFVDKSPLHD
jgi:hypothetical protein